MVPEDISILKDISTSLKTPVGQKSLEDISILKDIGLKDIRLPYMSTLGGRRIVPSRHTPSPRQPFTGTANHFQTKYPGHPWTMRHPARPAKTVLKMKVLRSHRQLNVENWTIRHPRDLNVQDRYFVRVLHFSKFCIWQLSYFMCHKEGIKWT